MVILTVIRLIFWLFIIPVLTGALCFRFLARSKQTVAISLITGYLILFSVLEWTAVPCMLFITYSSFDVFVKIFTVEAIALAVIGGYQMVRRWGASGIKNIFPGDRHPTPEALMDPRRDVSRFRFRYSTEAKICRILFFMIMGFQLYMAVTRASFDGDDAYYVTESVIADQAGVMNTILPYTGMSTELDIRHALAAITMWVAFIARMCGIHAAVTAHVVVPLIAIPFTYLIYKQIAVILFRSRHNLQPAFMVIIALFQMFGNVSIYTNETFFLTRTWQGKSFMANACIPLIFWVFLWMFESAYRPERTPLKEEAYSISKRERFGPWIVLMLVNIFAGVCTSMGVALAAALSALLTFFFFLYTGKKENLLFYVLSMVPNMVYVVLFLGLLPEVHR